MIYSFTHCWHVFVLCHPNLPFHTRQETFTKTAGKKSKTSVVELDLGDMLAALEKQQQAMKARQLNNTKPLSFAGRYSSILSDHASAQISSLSFLY